MMIFCMLLTQYTKNLILKSQYSVPNLISELQSDKNKGKQARDIRWRHQSITGFFFHLLENKSMPASNVFILSDGWRYNKGLVHPWDTTTHCRSAIPGWRYLKLNTNSPKAQQTDPPHPAPPSTTTVDDCNHTKCHRRTASPVYPGGVCHLQGGMGYYEVHWVAGEVDEDSC